SCPGGRPSARSCSSGGLQARRCQIDRVHAVAEARTQLEAEAPSRSRRRVTEAQYESEYLSCGEPREGPQPGFEGPQAVNVGVRDQAREIVGFYGEDK